MVGLWLLAVAAVVLAMITVGGLTRITGSGLSITEWDPIMGVVPPISAAGWHEAFAKDQRIPQYIHENRGMSLETFKSIFWGEGSRRRLGRRLVVACFARSCLSAGLGAIRRIDG